MDAFLLVQRFETAIVTHRLPVLAELPISLLLGKLLC